MPNETPVPPGLNPLDSFWARFIPPAAISSAWWLSGIELLDPCEHAKNWKILALAFAVFWLAACGSRLVIRRQREAIWLATAFTLLGLVFGWRSSLVGSYWGHVFYGATHALVIGALGLFLFVAMTRSHESKARTTRLTTWLRNCRATPGPSSGKVLEPDKAIETES
jgi:hypothetical protein